MTTFASVAASIEQIGASRDRAMAQHFGLVAQAMDANDPSDTGSSVAVFASAGSQTLGGMGQVGLGNGFVLSGALFSSSADYDGQAYGSAHLYSSLTIGASLRYVMDAGTWHPFVELGGWTIPNAKFEVRRAYMNGAGVAIGAARPDASLSYVYLRGGAVVNLDPDDTLVFTAEIGRERLQTDAFNESLTAANPFEAHYSEATDKLSVFKLSAGWSHDFNERISADVSAAWAHGFDQSSDLVVTVPGFGALTPNQSGDMDWAEYGASISYKVSDRTTVSIFADGVAGPDRSIGSETHAGISVRLAF